MIGSTRLWEIHSASSLSKEASTENLDHIKKHEIQFLNILDFRFFGDINPSTPKSEPIKPPPLEHLKVHTPDPE